MAEILLPDCQFRRLSDGATCRDIQPQALCQACTAHVQVAALRTRLEEIEWSSGVAEQAARKETERADLLFIEKERLRTRLESTEAARREAQESRLDLIIQNEELGAELAATRTRLENVEEALREAEVVLAEVYRCHHLPMYSCPCAHRVRGVLGLDPADAALGAAGERSEG